MPQALGIRKIRGGRGHFVDRAGLHIHTDLFFVAVLILLLALTLNPGLPIYRHFRQHLMRNGGLWQYEIPVIERVH